jgi:hypothetical protein
MVTLAHVTPFGRLSVAYTNVLFRIPHPVTENNARYVSHDGSTANQFCALSEPRRPNRTAITSDAAESGRPE